MALLYANGADVEQDDAESVKWLRLAGEQRDGMAVAAYKWLDIAERWRPNSWWTTETPDGEVRLTEQIRRLAEGMTAEQVAEARLAADTFLETYRDPSAGDDALPPRPDLGWDVPAGTTRAS